MSDTPRTDAARILWRDIGKPLSPDASTNADYGYYVSAQLFRTLERSLAHKEELLKQCQKYVPNVLKERIERELAS